MQTKELIVIDKGMNLGTITKDNKTSLAYITDLQAKIITATEQGRAKTICDTSTLLMVEITPEPENLWRAASI